MIEQHLVARFQIAAGLVDSEEAEKREEAAGGNGGNDSFQVIMETGNIINV